MNHFATWYAFTQFEAQPTIDQLQAAFDVIVGGDLPPIQFTINPSPTTPPPATSPVYKTVDGEIWPAPAATALEEPTTETLDAGEAPEDEGCGSTKG